MSLNVVEMPEDAQCQHCRWWTEKPSIGGDDPRWGMCKGGPPTWLKPDGTGIWPHTLAEEPMCGVFQLKWESDEEAE